MSGNQSNDELMGVTLDQLNDEKARAHYGAVIILAILILPGIIGNSHILYFYFFRKSDNPTCVFILFLAAIDLVASTICFPSIMVNYLTPFKIYNDPFCRLLTFVTLYVTIGEAITLLAIAAERYRKICKPFDRQMTTRHARYACGVILSLAFVLTVPVPVLIGSTEKQTRHPNITGYECNVVKEHRGSVFEKSYYGCMLFVSAGACVVLSVLYTLIGIRVWQHQTSIDEMRTRMKNENEASRPSKKEASHGEEASASQGEELEMMANEMNDIEQEKVTDQSESVNIHTLSSGSDDNEETSDDSELSATVLKTLYKNHKGKNQITLKRKEIKKFKNLKKPVYMFTLLTVLYVLSYIPYPLLRLYQVFNPDFYKGLNYSGQVAFHSTRCFLFLNHVINSFIYMLFDGVYRSELKSFYSKLFCRQ